MAAESPAVSAHLFGDTFAAIITLVIIACPFQAPDARSMG
jgi:hypothetical protein